VLGVAGKARLLTCGARQLNYKADKASERGRIKEAATRALRDARAQQASNVAWIKDAMARIDAQEARERKLLAQGEAARARFVEEMTAKIDKGLAKERTKAEQALVRQRAQLEAALVQAGVEEEMRRVEAAERRLAKAEPTGPRHESPASVRAAAAPRGTDAAAARSAGEREEGRGAEQGARRPAHQSPPRRPAGMARARGAVTSALGRRWRWRQCSACRRAWML